MNNAACRTIVDTLEMEKEICLIQTVVSRYLFSYPAT